MMWRKLRRGGKARALARMWPERVGAGGSERELDLAFANWLASIHEGATEAAGQAALDVANQLDRAYQALAAEVKALESALRTRALVWGGLAVAGMLAWGYAKRGGRK